MNPLDGRNVLVLGLGESGLAMARFAARRGAARIRVADSRGTPPGAAVLRREVPAAELRCGAFERASFEGIDLVAISPGVALAEPEVQAAIGRGVPVAGDVELFARSLPAADRPSVLAITGTNGKTTVTALAGALARAGGIDAEVAGNISPSALDALMAREDAGTMPEAWVLELSSYQLETTYSLAPDVATMLNLTEDHLDRYPSMREYGAAKARIFQGEGRQVLNRDDTASLAMRRPGRRVTTFGLGAAGTSTDYGLAERVGGFVIRRGTRDLVEVDRLQLAGLHNAANAMAALALVDDLGLPETTVVPALVSFRGLPHRVELVATIDEVRYFDDSKGTNVGSTVAALAGFAAQLAPRGAKVVLIAGGVGKGQDFAPLADAVRGAARAVVTIGVDGPAIVRAVRASGVPVEPAATLDEAIDRARALARSGDVVLLSPACASFDMFNSYKDRGERFARAVRARAEAPRG